MSTELNFTVFMLAIIASLTVSVASVQISMSS